MEHSSADRNATHNPRASRTRCCTVILVPSKSLDPVAQHAAVFDVVEQAGEAQNRGREKAGYPTTGSGLRFSYSVPARRDSRRILLIVVWSLWAVAARQIFGNSRKIWCSQMAAMRRFCAT